MHCCISAQSLTWQWTPSMSLGHAWGVINLLVHASRTQQNLRNIILYRFAVNDSLQIKVLWFSMERTLYANNCAVFCITENIWVPAVYAIIYLSQIIGAVHISSYDTTMHCISQQRWLPGVHVEPCKPGYYLSSWMWFHCIYSEAIFNDAKHRTFSFPSLRNLSHKHTQVQNHHYMNYNCGMQLLKGRFMVQPYPLQSQFELHQLNGIIIFSVRLYHNLRSFITFVYKLEA